MRGIKPDNINTRCADSLEEDWPLQADGGDIGKPLYVDAVVSNPPYSQQWVFILSGLIPRITKFIRVRL